MFHTFHIHSSAGAYLSYFHLLALVNKAAMYVGV